MQKMNQPEMKIFSGSAHPALTKKICESIGEEMADVTLTSFPDGETFVKINENIRGRDVFVVQPTCPPTNQNLMEMLIMVDAARRASADRITAVLPFFGYARQDRKDQPRVPITAKLVANLLVASGVDRVVSLDLHADQLQGFFDIPVDHLYSLPVHYKHIMSRDDMKDCVIVAPDVGALKMASMFSQSLHSKGAGLAFVAKRRISASETEALHVIGDVEGRNVLLVDDMTETAGTLVSAARLLKQHGAKEIRAAVTHAILGNLAIERLLNSDIQELICTDSAPVQPRDKPRITVLTVADLLGQAIKCIHQNSSVTNLFRINGNNMQ